METFQIAETILFWCCVVTIIVSAIGVCLAKKPVHAIVSMLLVMLSLAVIYIGLDATFLGITQIVVYTGAILMLFLFVVMLIGTHNEDKKISSNPKKSLKILGIGFGLVFILLLMVELWTLEIFTQPKQQVKELIVEHNPNYVAYSIFGQHYFSLHLAGILLVTSAMSALLLVHKGRKEKTQTQQELVEEKMREFAEGKQSLGQKTIPGVYAISNASNMENISGETGQVIEDSVFSSYKASGQIGKAPENHIEIIDGSTGEKQ